MRPLLMLLLGALFCALAPAQARQVRLELNDGKVVEGRVLEIDSRAIVVDVGGKRVEYVTDQIRSARFTEVEGPAPTIRESEVPASPAGETAPRPSGGTTAPIQEPRVAADTRPPATAPSATGPSADTRQPGPGGGGRPAATPDGAGPGLDTPRDSAPLDGDGDTALGTGTDPASPRKIRRGPGGLWEYRMQALDRRYPWLFPAEPLQWISLGVMLFSLLSLAVHFAARMAATDQLGFGRATGIGTWLLLSSIGQIAVVPTTTEAMIGAAAGNTVVMVVLFGLAYSLSFGGAMLATFLLAIEGGLGFALLQLVDATLRSIGNATF